MTVFGEFLPDPLQMRRKDNLKGSSRQHGGGDGVDGQEEGRGLT